MAGNWVARSKELWPLAAKEMAPMGPICVPAALRRSTGTLVGSAEMVLIATPVAVLPVLSNASRYVPALRLSRGTTASWPLGS